MKYFVRISTVFFLFTILACNSQKEKKVMPAVVENPVKESDLTTVRLTEKAVERLGIKTKPVEQQSVNLTRTYSGELMAVPGSSMILMAPVSGTVLGLKDGRLPAAGSPVKKGQLLYRLMILPSEKDLLGASEDAKLKQVQYDVAVQKLVRAQQLLKDKAGSVRAVQDAESELANVTASLRVAEARVELMKGNSSNGVSDKLSTLSIESSVDGFIQRVYASPSQVVSANAPVIEVASIMPLWVRVPVYAGELNTIDKHAGATVRTLSEFNGSANQATAKSIDGPRTADPLNTSADVYYELANKDGQFRPGQKVSVVLPVEDQKASLVIPFSAILYDINGGTWVYENSTPLIFIRRRVELSNVENGMAILRKGPASGTQIVIEGAAELFGTEFGGAK